MFSFSEFLENIRNITDAKKFSTYIESSFEELEAFFLTLNTTQLKELKFDFEDLLYDLIDNKLIKEKNSTYVDAFLILLAEQFEQANLISAIKLIYEYLPESSLKYRLEAAMLYLRVNDISTQYHKRFVDILNLIEKAKEFEECEYRIIKSTLNYFLTAMEQFSRVKNQELSQNFINLFVENKNRYEILNNPFIVDVVQKVNIGNYADIIKNIYSQIDKFSTSNIECNVLPTSSSSFIETSDYASKLYSLNTPNFKNILQISFDYIQAIGDPQILHTQLNQGVKIIDDEKLLYKYMVAYGYMHKAKLYASFERLLASLNNITINVIDWGCGQALATMLLIEYIREHNLDINIENIILIEPSKLAIGRGLVHIDVLKQKKYNIKPLNVDLDCVKNKDVAFEDKNIVLHLFSNILDVEFFQLNTSFFEKISKNIQSDNYFVCVSPNINAKRNSRLDRFYKYFDESFNTELISSRDDKAEKYTRYEKIFKVKYIQEKEVIETREVISHYHVDIYTKLENYADLIEPTLNTKRLKENIEDDPDYVIFKIRKVAEIITSKIFMDHGGEDENRVSQNDKIRYLSFEKKILSRKAQSHLHTIRTIGNIGTHEHIENPAKMLKDDAYFLATALTLLIEDLQEHNLV